MGNRKHKPQAKSAELQRSPFFTPEDLRSLFVALFKGEDKVMMRIFLLGMRCC
jgi:hypothetical protein